MSGNKDEKEKKEELKKELHADKETLATSIHSKHQDLKPIPDGEELSK